MILIDSSGWIEYFSAGPLADKYEDHIEHANANNTITSIITVYEVYKKIKRESSEEEALEAYAQICKTKIIELDESIAIEAADFSLQHKLGMADAVIYATAQRFNAKIVTSDTDFEGLKDVEILKK